MRYDDQTCVNKCSALLIAEVATSRQTSSSVVGACVVDFEIHGAINAPHAKLGVTVRSCLSQHPDMLFGLGWSISSLVAEMLEQLLCTTIGCEYFYIQMILETGVPDRGRISKREQTAIGEVLGYVRNLNFDKFREFRTDVLSQGGIEFPLPTSA